MPSVRWAETVDSAMPMRAAISEQREPFDAAQDHHCRQRGGSCSRAASRRCNSCRAITLRSGAGSSSAMPSASRSAMESMETIWSPLGAVDEQVARHREHEGLHGMGISFCAASYTRT